MTSPIIPVSWGELLDKITILEIKTHRLRAPEARANAAEELGMLRQVARDARVAELGAALQAVNTRLWHIEDLIREKEAVGDFGAGFVALARAVYRENDERGRIKQAINRRLRSALVEEKQYPAYHPGITVGAPSPSVRAQSPADLARDTWAGSSGGNVATGPRS